MDDKNIKYNHIRLKICDGLGGRRMVRIYDDLFTDTYCMSQEDFEGLIEVYNREK